MSQPGKRTWLGGARKVFREYQRNAIIRKIKFKLTFFQFINLTQKPCTYCGIEHNNFLSLFKYNGVDRKDNTKGYTKQNSVTCCHECNAIKGASVSYKEMLAIGKLRHWWRQKKVRLLRLDKSELR